MSDKTKAIQILLAGDSTVADYPKEDYPMMGWGQALGKLFEPDQKIKIKNFAKPGSTTRSFMEEGLFQQLVARINKQDIVLFQFGHNDQKKEQGVSLNDYYNRLTMMVQQVKQLGGRPILFTPTERRVDGTNQLGHTLAEFQPILRRIASENIIPLYDLNRYTYFLYQQKGLEDSKAFFVWSGPRELDNYPMGSGDNTHFSEKGAMAIARYVKIRLSEYLQETRFKKLYYGACMYPEVWEKAIFEQDVAHMASIGMNFARFGEFAWESIEPAEGEFDLSLFEMALETYQKHGIDVCLCIPTPTPPRWFTKKYPASKIKNIDGTFMEHGSRQHVCTNNEEFRRYAYRMTRKVANLAQKYSNVIAIQLDNEFKCHVDLCYCDTCRKRWYEYLEIAYQTPSFMNDSWGTNIWSERYDQFEEVVLPTRTPFLHNSSLMNTFRKFTTDTLNEFAHDLCHFVRMETAVPITHNSAFGFNLMNEELFADLDVAGFDTYPPADNYPAYTLNLDRWRNVKAANNEMLLLETCTSHAGHLENYLPASPAGWITAEMFIGLAGNLKSFCFWHYRSHRFGVEQPHSAVLTAWGEPDIGYEDVVENGKLLPIMQKYIAESNYQPAKIALMYSDNSKRFYTIENGGQYDYRSLITDYYGSLIRSGISVEVIQESTDYTNYELIIIPYVRCISETMLAKLKYFVASGGKLILGPMTGDRTEELAWPKTNGLDRIGEWLDLQEVKQFVVTGAQAVGEYQGNKFSLSGLITTFNGGQTWEVLAEDSAQRTFIAKRQVGRGEVIYVGGQPNQLTGNKSWQTFINKEILPFESDRDLISISGEIKKYRRQTADGTQIYLANMTETTSSYQLKETAVELISNQILQPGKYPLTSYQHQILAFY